MNCEIEFLAVGEGSRAGDAIVIRYGAPDAYELMIIDGGNAETGEQIVSHIQKYFGNRRIAHVLLTHPDIDHASGLRTVVEKMNVGTLWLNAPWVAASIRPELYKDTRWTADGLKKYVQSEYDIVTQIETTAHARAIRIELPLQGVNVGPFTVLSPSADALIHLVPQFDRTPEENKDAIEAAGNWIGKETPLARALAALQAKAASWVPESWGFEGLRDDGITSATNESSVVLYGRFDSPGSVLLTGDAGRKALAWAADYAEAHGLPLRGFAFAQIPHHGSRRNVGPTVLNRIIGMPVPHGTTTGLRAYASAPKDDETHPRKIVLNAFKRRGASLYATQGLSKVNYGGFPPRPDYSPAVELPFYDTVEGYT